MSEINPTEVMDTLEGLAVIGMAGCFPGARTVAELWSNLVRGVESISKFSDEEILAAGVDPELLRDPKYVRAGAVLERPEWFDARFFDINPREAELLDPQHRVFLECTYAALEDAGYNPDAYSGSIGVFAGAGTSDYLVHNICSNRALVKSLDELDLIIGNDRDHLTTRVSYKLNLTGPSHAVQTACSTSLTAIHIACENLLNRQCDIALAGGVSIKFPHRSGYLFREGGITSPDGHCRAFDERAEGTVFGSGAGVVVLKRLEEAVADRDHIYAVVKGSAINNDGASKIGYTAPSVEGQGRVISEAIAVAGFKPESISYVETHGTGTPLGDPIEIAGLAKAFASTENGTESKGQFCAIGSIKTNIGHLVAAAGVAGFIKTALALKHKQLPASLHYEKPNPKIDFGSTPFYVNAKLAEWSRGTTPRRAGVSSFGVGGTNAHTVLEEAPDAKPGSRSRNAQLVLLSAKTSTALEAATENLVGHFKAHPDESLPDAAYTLKVGRKALRCRRMVVCASKEDLVKTLEAKEPGKVFSGAADPAGRSVVFMFPGQGAQYVNMGRDLYEQEAVFREEADRCAELLRGPLGFDLRTVLYPEKDWEDRAGKRLQQTFVTQPALFVVEYALARLWQEWGVQPQAMVGHSIGEYVAGCLAGVFSLADALTLVAARGRFMQACAPGGMLSVPLPETEVQPFLVKDTSVASVNAPTLTVVSGPMEALDDLEKRLQAKGIEPRRVHTSHAFHSFMMDPVLGQFGDVFRTVTLRPPKTPFVSNLTGTWITEEQATDRNYWVQHLRQPVRFGAAIQTLLKEPNRLFLEVGPGRMLSTFAKLQLGKAGGPGAIPTMRHVQDEQSDVAFLLQSAGQLWLQGVGLDWAGFYKGEERNRVSLPTYAFDRQRYWIEPKKSGSEVLSSATPAGRHSDVADWFYVPSWRRSELPPGKETAAEAARWLIFLDECGVGEQLSLRLRKQAKTVVQLRVGKGYSGSLERGFTINPSSLGDYETLLKELRASGNLPQHIVHLWNLTHEDPNGSDPELTQATEGSAFYSLLFLAQALSRQGISDPIQISAVSDGLQEVTGEEPLCPSKAMLLGPCRVIPHEYPNLSCRSIDVLLPAQETRFEEVTDQLLSEFGAKASASVVAYRGKHRWVQMFEAERLEEGSLEKARLRERGVYLITGGMGGIGLALAEYLAQTVQARLVLIGRSGLPERTEWKGWLEAHGEKDPTSEKIRKLQKLEELGAEVMLASASVVDANAVEGVVAEAVRRFGTIHGVIHSAGLPGGGLIELKTPEQTERVLGPKVKGTLVLHRALQETKLDFFVLCSSLTSVLGGLGQVDYCAANAFLDSFAQWRTSKYKSPTLSLDWDAWSEVGMAFNTVVPGELKQRQQEILALGITPKEGAQAFRRALGGGAAQLLVSPTDFIARSKQLLASLPTDERTNESSEHPIESVHARPELQTAYKAPRTEIEQSLVEVWQSLLGVEKVGIQDNWFDLGGHSLLAIRLFGHVEKIAGKKFPLATLFQAPTIEQLVATLTKEDWKAPWECLVAIQPNGTRPPFYCVHGVGGNAVEYLDLARHLPPHQPLYGIQAQGLDGKKPRHKTIEEMAAHYIKEIRSLQPNGPYYLGGSSFGGMVAFEIAQRLSADGETIAFLGLFDTTTPGYPKFLPSLTPFRKHWFHFRFRLELHLGNLQIADSHQRGEYVRVKAKKFWADVKKHKIRKRWRRIKNRFHNLFLPKEIVQVQKSGFMAHKLYVPKPFNGKITLFRATQQPYGIYTDPTLGWDGYALGGLEIHDVPGHHGAIVREPRAPFLAEKLIRCLDQACAAQSGDIAGDRAFAEAQAAQVA